MKNAFKTLLNTVLLCTFVSVTQQGLAESLVTSDTVKTTPNIVLILADDMSWFDIGAYHQAIDYVPKNAITPNIDKIAEEGMMFTRSFTATAMCAVTRQQLYTGIYPVRNGAYGNHTRVYDGVKSAAHYFRDMGYRVGLAGKGHIFPKAAFPFEKAGGENKTAKGESSFGIDVTRRFMARDKDQPFFLIVASANPHGPWNRGDTKQYPKNKLEVPVFLNDTPGLRHRLSQYLAEVSDLDREVGLLEAEVEKLGIKNDTIFIFTSEQGSSLPFGKWTNYDSGLQTAFIIRWPNNIEAGTTSAAMIEYVDVVPTLTDLVKGTVPENLDGSSFKPVLLGQATEHKDYVYGIQTSLNVHEGAPYPIRSVRGKQYKLIHNIYAEGKFSNVITENDWFKDELKAEKKINKSNYARYVTRPEFELYDIIKDPFEQENIIDQPQYKDKITALKSHLSNWMAQQGDLGLETEMVVCERKGFSHRRCP